MGQSRLPKLAPDTHCVSWSVVTINDNDELHAQAFSIDKQMSLDSPVHSKRHDFGRDVFREGKAEGLTNGTGARKEERSS